MATSKNDILDGVVKRVDDALASGQKLPWQKPWEPQYGAMSMPHNPVTGKMYSPGNTMILSIAAMDHGHDDPRYMTYKQARDAGWSVRKGEHAAAHIYAPITKTLDDEKTGTEQQKLVGYRGVALFNAAQIDGIPPMAIVPESERLPKTMELDAIAQQMGVGIQHSGGMAFYRSSDDRIQLPPRETFTDQHGYDATKAHELTHATGHPSRLNRDKQYQTVKGRAAEEMTAEIGAYLMSQRLGVPFLGNSPDQTDEQHAAYLAGWARDLTPEERRAAIDNGIKAATYMEKQLELARANGLIVEADRGQVVDHAMAGHSPAMESSISPLPAGAAEVAIPHPDQSQDKPILRNVPEGLRPFMSNSQRMATEAGLRGEEKLFFSEKMREMKDLVDKMPVSYGTDGLGDTAPVTLHYYSGNADWYIMEKDIDHDGEGQLQAFGLADLGMGEPELGYINIRELVEHGAEMDYHFPPRTLLELKQEKYPEMIREVLTEPVLSPVNSSHSPAQPQPVHLNPSDLIQFRDGNGVQKTGIVLREIDNRDSDKSLFFQYKAIMPGKDGQPFIQQAGNSLGIVQKSDISVQVPNAVSGIEKLDMQSKRFENDDALRPGIKAALEYRVASVMHKNNLTLEEIKQEPTMEKAPEYKDPAKGLMVQSEKKASVSTTPAEWRAWKDQELAAAMERLGGYSAVLADPEKSLELQDMLDSALGERGVDIRNSLRNSGDWGPGGMGELVSDDAVLNTHATRVGAGANMTQLHWHITMPELDPGGKPRIIDDLLDRSADDFAAHITEQAMEMQRDHWRRLDVLPQKEVADRASLLPEEKVAPLEIQRGDHLVYRDGPGCIEDGFASAAHGSQITVIPMDRDKNGAIATWVMRPITVQQDQIIKHTASASVEAVSTLFTGNQRMTDKAFGGVRRAAYKALSKSAFVEMKAAQVIQDKPEIDKLNAERASQLAEANARNKINEQKRLAGIHAEQVARIAEKESRFAEAFNGGPHALEDNKAYPLNPGDYVSYVSPSGRGIDCIVRDKAALPAEPTQRNEVIYQRVERGGLSGDGQYELGLAVAGDISKSSIMEHSRDFLPERAQIKKGNSSALDEALDKRMQQKREEDSSGKTAKARPAVRQKDLGLER